MKRVISTKSAPAAIGPYSQAVSVNGFLFTSGQIGIVPSTGNFAGDDITSQTKQVMENLKNILAEAGLTFSNIVKTTVFIKDMEDFATVNAIYAEYFNEEAPARSCVAVSALPKGALIEIEMIAFVD